ncbi:sensor histidine kinase [[Clostridium] dakarense]|uniref:sensor histidine kinase n=1 Tax=Faecalimicrobium dakarense TaxID=1301100 RepID=UPI001FAA4F6F|nr:sensor histidine kinase [[Clostridium] dakarense]
MLDLSLSKILNSLIYINTLIVITCIVFFILGYLEYKKKYNELYNHVNNNIKKENSLFNPYFYDVIDTKLDSYENNIQNLKYELQEINDYMTNWIHQVKIPIAVLEIISQRVKELENQNNLHNESNLYKEINIELKRIESLVGQALYISRSGNYSSDFLIEEVNLEKVIKEIVRRNKHLFIYNKIDLKLENLDINVLTDKKWITHIVEQIIDNSCKYIEKSGQIEIYATKNEKSIKLHIKDNGIGIAPQDIERVFDKGFTGENGRKKTKSTGMGLYISKKILSKLSHSIDVFSTQGEFCDIYITFYNLSDYFTL